MINDKIKKYFPGTNSPFGFCSCYDHIINETANRIYLLKGGPGVGKSSFMKYLGDKLEHYGVELEYHFCSSDNASLDGLKIPSLEVAVIDGTAPHLRDPVFPGVVDEIINLGDFWDQSKLVNHKKDIINLSREIKDYFGIAYQHLGEAYRVYEGVKRIYQGKTPPGDYFSFINTMEKYYLETGRKNLSNGGNYRSMFIAAITPDGFTHHMDSVWPRTKKTCVLKGSDLGITAQFLIDTIASRALERGYYVEKYHSPFDPVKTDAIILPEINLGLINEACPFYKHISPLKESVIFEVDLEIPLKNEEYRYLEGASGRIFSSIERAVDYLKSARNRHKKLEDYYVEAMDFEALEEKREQTLKKIEELMWISEYSLQNR